MKIPRLYAIVDVGVLAGRGVGLREFAEELAGAGVGLVQLRYKDGQPQAVLRAAAVVREAFAGRACRLVMNDRADLAVLAGWDGVHVGQEDLPVADARRVLGGAPHPAQGRDGWNGGRSGHIVGISTHTDAQVVAASEPGPSGSTGRGFGMGQPEFGPDYIAMGPVFGTGTKRDAAPAVGLEGVRRARALTRKPLVAIGGITRENARSVLEAGADAVAMISGLLPGGDARLTGRIAAELMGSL